MAHYDATWNGDTITILTEDRERAELIAAEVFSVDSDSPEIEEYGGLPEMTEGQEAHAKKCGWFDSDDPNCFCDT